MIYGSHAEKPNGRPEAIPARDHLVHDEQLVQIEQQPRQVRHEEHAHDAHEDQRQLEVFGLRAVAAVIVPVEF